MDDKGEEVELGDGGEKLSWAEGFFEWSSRLLISLLSKLWVVQACCDNTTLMPIVEKRKPISRSPEQYKGSHDSGYIQKLAWPLVIMRNTLSALRQRDFDARYSGEATFTIV